MRELIAGGNRDPGELVFEWVDDKGLRGSERAAINVTG